MNNRERIKFLLKKHIKRNEILDKKLNKIKLEVNKTHKKNFGG